MTDTPAPKGISQSLNIGLGLGIVFIILMFIGFWLLFVKPLQFAGTAAVHGLDNSSAKNGMITTPVTPVKPVP